MQGPIQPNACVALFALGCGLAVATGGCDDDPKDVGASDASVEGHLDASEPVDADGVVETPEAGDDAPLDSSRPDAPADAGMGRDDAGHSLTRRAQFCGTNTSFPAPLPEAGQREAQPVGSDTFGFIEGAVWLAEQGVLLFSDMDFGGDDAQGPPARIRRLRPPTSFDVLVAASNSNGLALDADGRLWGATHDNQGVSRFDPVTGARTPYSVRTDGKHLNSPNDLVFLEDGTAYLTDPDWQLGPRTRETDVTGVYRIDPPLREGADNAAILVDGTLDKPNGIALSPDETTLYVGSSGSEIWKYPVQPDGSLGTRTKFADTGSSDGLTVDCAGNLYVTSGSVEVFAPDGQKLGDITLGGSPSNVAFGGTDRKTLYITAGSRLYAIALRVPGFPY